MSFALHRMLCDWRLVRLFGGFVCGLIPIATGCTGFNQIGETEGNNTTATASLLRQHEYGFGDINPAADVDVWRAPRAPAGHLIFAYVDTFASPAMQRDSVLRVLSNVGTEIEVDDDDGPPPGLMNSSAVAGANVPASGDVFYEVTEKDNNGTITDYRIYQAIVDPAQTSNESEPNNTAMTADAITAPLVIGNLFMDPVDYFKFQANQGDRIVVIMDDDPDNNGMPTGTGLVILDTDGMTTLANGAGDDLISANGNAAGAAVASAPGTYFVRVAFGGGETNYRFVLLVNGVAYSDRDADGFADHLDNCPTIPNPTQTDTDDDRFGDECDACPMNELKIAPGACGCNQPDVDVDGDGNVDCNLADPARSLLGSRGLLLVPDNLSDRVMAFDPETGDLVDPNFIPSDMAHISTAVSAILSADGERVLVSDSSTDAVHAYDLDGNYVDIFAPAGGVDTMILDAPTGLALRANGNLLVGVGGGANAGAVAEFDTDGNYVGNFVEIGAGGLGVAAHLLHHAGELFVSDLGGNMIRRYNAETGGFLGNFASVHAGPQQLATAASGRLLAAALAGNRRGILEFASNGTVAEHFTPPEVFSATGLHELPSGNLLVTAFFGVYEVDRDGNLVEPKLLDRDAKFIEFALLDADGDGVGDDIDPCPLDAADDSDGDGVCDSDDQCPDAPDVDTDADGLLDCNDNCPNDANADQADANADGIGDACEQPAGQACCGGGLPVLLPLALFGLAASRRRRTPPRESERDAR